MLRATATNSLLPFAISGLRGLSRSDKRPFISRVRREHGSRSRIRSHRQLLARWMGRSNPEPLDQQKGRRVGKDGSPATDLVMGVACAGGREDLTLRTSRECPESDLPIENAVSWKLRAVSRKTEETRIV